ncbi:MAG: MarR family transcriptional regulator [Planctomycetaceae bacterium]|nr:MarR family transcriptional regulator [Planctomycetaceae bacterium]
MAGGRLQHEIKKRRPFDSLEQQAILNLHCTSDQIQFCFTRLSRRHGLTRSQYNILRILRGVGKPLAIVEIANRMIAVASGITGLIDRLEGMGLATRERSTEDRRVIFVAITDKVLRLLAGLVEPVMELHRRVAAKLSPAELKEVFRLLEKGRQPIAPEVE